MINLSCYSAFLFGIGFAFLLLLIAILLTISRHRQRKRLGKKPSQFIGLMPMSLADYDSFHSSPITLRDLRDAYSWHNENAQIVLHMKMPHIIVESWYEAFL